jgi:hypothetical protein
MIFLKRFVKFFSLVLLSLLCAAIVGGFIAGLWNSFACASVATMLDLREYPMLVDPVWILWIGFLVSLGALARMFPCLRFWL